MADNKLVVTPRFRVSFPKLDKPHAMQEGQEPKYSLQMAFDSDADLTAMKTLAKAAAEAKWGNNIPKGCNPVFRDGNETDRPELQDKLFANAKSKMPVGLFDRDRNPIIDPLEVYAGCYARATVTAFGYDVSGNKGVAFGLNNVQKLADGERFSGRVSNGQDFPDDLGDEAPADFSDDAGESDSMFD